MPRFLKPVDLTYLFYCLAFRRNSEKLVDLIEGPRGNHRTILFGGGELAKKTRGRVVLGTMREDGVCSLFIFENGSKARREALAATEVKKDEKDGMAVLQRLRLSALTNRHVVLQTAAELEKIHPDSMESFGEEGGKPAK